MYFEVSFSVLPIIKCLNHLNASTSVFYKNEEGKKEVIKKTLFFFLENKQSKGKSMESVMSLKGILELFFCGYVM